VPLSLQRDTAKGVSKKQRNQNQIQLLNGMMQVENTIYKTLAREIEGTS
jgi:hypothetical protein